MYTPFSFLAAVPLLYYMLLLPLPLLLATLVYFFFFREPVLANINSARVPLSESIFHGYGFSALFIILFSEYVYSYTVNMMDHIEKKDDNIGYL